ncbi:L,D-transpeptidase family protein [Microvirga pudoricolor]|uniref:L,D-transpeptidase family protein n=1 Tax=Microvirga pudoricolor TaxID=2778729 RepID=UPI00194F9A79|nr:L,D-transpeptidase family protein [Microvirga pudoricolor]MBM6594951.1 L,D-transpeptidase family protein [Microvirga pudoricolor]
MKAFRKAVGMVGLAGSVSLIALAAMAEDIGLPEPPAPAPVSIEAAAAPQPAEAAVQDPAIPEVTPAPVTITAQDAAPKAASPEIVLPDMPPAAVVFTATDWLRAAMTQVLADETFVKSLRLDSKNTRALTAYYAETSAPALWTKGGAWNPGALALAGTIRNAAEDGLDPTDYPLPDMGAPRGWNDKAWAEAELKLSAAAVRYARDARGARINPARLSNLVAPSMSVPDAGEVLASLASSKNPGITLNAYNPPQLGYQALKARLARLRENRVTRPMVNVPRGPILKVGMRDPRVPLIRARFNLGPAGGDETAYDERVASAVADFQKKEGLPTNGNLNAQTIAALGGPSPARLEGDLVANMERWRWLPRDLGQKHIMVNVPEYRLRLSDSGRVVHQTRVIVGKAESQTPIFSETMKYLVVNPSWTVPPSILKKEFLPGLAADPSYAARRGYKVIRRGNSISVQQPPGERNALGWVKFMFPNNYAVYLHDTPNRNLFNAEKRAFSHGCVRVDQPFELAEEIIGAQGWPEKKLRGLIGKGERYIHLKEPLPVHLTYFTLSVDEDGNTRSFDDIYGLHRKVRSALGLDS